MIPRQQNPKGTTLSFLKKNQNIIFESTKKHNLAAYFHGFNKFSIHNPAWELGILAEIQTHPKNGYVAYVCWDTSNTSEGIDTYKNDSYENVMSWMIGIIESKINVEVV